jgi:hypothetical protein
VHKGYSLPVKEESYNSYVSGKEPVDCAQPSLAWAVDIPSNGRVKCRQSWWTTWLIQAQDVSVEGYQERYKCIVVLVCGKRKFGAWRSIYHSASR